MPSRTELSQALRGLPVWEEVSKQYRSAVPKASRNGDFAKCLQSLMAKGTAGKAAYQKCAETYKLSDKLSSVWSD